MSIAPVREEGKTGYKRAWEEAVGRRLVVWFTPLTDETSVITAGAGKYTFRAPFNLYVRAIRAAVSVAPTGAALVLDVNVSGVSMLSTKLSIDATEKTSLTAATTVVLAYNGIKDDSEIVIDFDQVGSVESGRGVKLTFIGDRVGG